MCNIFRIEVPGSSHKICTATFYTLMTFLSFYSDCSRLPTAVKYGVDLAVFFWAGTAFLLHPKMERARLCGRFLVLFACPYLVFWMWSAGVWIAELQQAAYILRGTKNIVYMALNLLFVCSAIYLLGKDAVPCTFLAMGLANTLVLVQVLRDNGIQNVLDEFLRLLTTFSADTGSVVRQLELHGLAFGWGAFFLYFLTVQDGSSARRWTGLFVSGLFFALSFKRIVVLGILAGGLVFVLVRRLCARHLRWFAFGMAVAVGAAAYVYLAWIQDGTFFALAEKLNINLMFRDVLYRFYSPFFRLSPTFFGHGIRFIYAYAAMHPEAYEAVHNVYLELYLEVGFWCWWFWILYELAFRVHRVLAWRYRRGAGLLTVMNAFVFCTYLTDNTSFYFAINVIYRMLVMRVCLAEEESGPLPGDGDTLL